MMALTLWQPWASAVALGLKQWETRSWPTNFRGPIAIHASKSPRDTKKGLSLDTYFNHLTGDDLLRFHEYGFTRFDQLPFGAVVAVAAITDCLPVEKAEVDAHEMGWGDYTPGRFALKLENVRPLARPIEVSGMRGLWAWNGEGSREALALAMQKA